MNVYPAALDAFLTGSIDITTATVNAQLVDAGYSYSAAHTSVADLAGTTISTPVAVTVDAPADGIVTVDPVTFTAVPAGNTIAGLVFYIDGGVLVCHVDRRADTVPLAIVTADQDITFTFTRLFKI